MFKNILVAIDGSGTAAKGFQTALGLAREQAALLHVVHVVDERGPVMYPEGGAFVSEMIELLRESGKKILAQAEQEAAGAGVQCKTMLVETLGLPVAEVILAQVKEASADLIVLGTHGRRGLKRIVMGSDAEGVLRESPVPVLMVRAPDAD
jgi:nucleotide-binding universal stress UspA family protein